MAIITALRNTASIPVVSRPHGRIDLKGYTPSYNLCTPLQVPEQVTNDYTAVTRSAAAKARNSATEYRIGIDTQALSFQGLCTVVVFWIVRRFPDWSGPGRSDATRAR
jgi:hypothetical protein